MSIDASASSVQLLSGKGCEGQGGWGMGPCVCAGLGKWWTGHGGGGGGIDGNAICPGIGG